jgi:hypothetical protein
VVKAAAAIFTSHHRAVPWRRRGAPLVAAAAGGRRRRRLMTAAAASEACRRSIRHPRPGSAAANMAGMGRALPIDNDQGKRRRRGGGGVEAADGDSLRPMCHRSTQQLRAV